MTTSILMPVTPSVGSRGPISALCTTHMIVHMYLTYGFALSCPLPWTRGFDVNTSYPISFHAILVKLSGMGIITSLTSPVQTINQHLAVTKHCIANRCKFAHGGIVVSHQPSFQISTTVDDLLNFSQSFFMSWYQFSLTYVRVF